MLDKFQLVGRDLFLQGLVSSHGGNLSVRLGDRLLITRRGSMLGHLLEQDIIETGIYKNDRATPLASSELEVHRAIYRTTSAQAIVHAHPPHSISFSLVQDVIRPKDLEGSYLLKEIPVLSIRLATEAPEEAQRVADVLREHPIVVIRGHGIFSVGQLLEEAYHWTSTLEASCRIALITENWRRLSNM